jgi:AmiR/NasT family two-component response regulator
MEKKAKILVVEDDRIISLEIKERLEEFNYGVIGSATTGEEAYSLASAYLPDLIIMDIHIEGAMDGIETALKIKNELNIPVVYLTAYADDFTIERAKITEPYGYIVKPLDERELKSAVEIALYKNKADKALKDSEARYKAIVDTIEGSLFLVNNERQITFSNKSFSDNYLSENANNEK